MPTPLRTDRKPKRTPGLSELGVDGTRRVLARTSWAFQPSSAKYPDLWLYPDSRMWTAIDSSTGLCRMLIAICALAIECTGGSVLLSDRSIRRAWASPSREDSLREGARQRGPPRGSVASSKTVMQACADCPWPLDVVIGKRSVERCRSDNTTVSKSVRNVVREHICGPR